MELTQIDTSYNGLNKNDQDSLNAAAGGNLLSKTTREALHIIKNKSKVRYSRNKPNVSRMNMTSRENASKTDDKIDKPADQILTLVDFFAKKVVTPDTVKAVEESCVTCGVNYAYHNCDATNSNKSSVCAATGTLPSNTIPNPKGDIKAITNRSGVAYERPSIPTNPSPKKVVERETEETTDKEQTNFQGSTAHIQPPVVAILEPGVPNILPKPNISYPSRLNDQRLGKKATNQMKNFFQIFQDLHFDISFADALLLMPKKKLSLPELTPTRVTFKLADRSITRPKGVTEDVFVKVGKFHFPTDFVVVDFKADPCVPLILGRSFLSTGRALIDVYREEITLRVNDEAVTFNLNQTTRYSSTYDDMLVNQIDVIDVAREEYAQEMLGFSNYSSGGNSTSTSEPIIFYSSPSLTPYYVKTMRRQQPSSKLGEMPLYGQRGNCLGHKISKNKLEVDRAKVDVIVKVPYPATVKGVRSFFGHAGFYRRFIQDFSKIARPMTHLLEKETPFVFSKDCIDAFETLKKKLTEAPILVVPDWNLPFELMCDASDFAIAVVLGQRTDIARITRKEPNRTKRTREQKEYTKAGNLSSKADLDGLPGPYQHILNKLELVDQL
nr:reverse transcriptase domain-containing protein [Tanacetum cinerariifolium]